MSFDKINTGEEQKMKKNLFEIYMTSEYVQANSWINLIYKVSKINGMIRPWNLWIEIENNYVRYYIETDRMLPTIIGNADSFLIKKVDKKLKEKSKISMPYIFTARYKTVIDVCDRFEAKAEQKLKKVKITFYPYKRNNYFSTTKIYLEDEERIIRKKLFGNFEVHEFISIDFETYNRFFYQKDEEKYLDIGKVVNFLDNKKGNSILKVNAFPYLQEDMYLNYENYDFAKHTLVVGASGTGKSKLISTMIKNLSNNSQSKLKYKVVVIDPHAAMENDIGGLENTNVIDFKSEESSINLFENCSDDILAVTEASLSIFKNIIADRYNSRLERVLRYSIHLLLAKGEFNLVTLRKVLTEVEYRNKLIKDIEDKIEENVIEFFRVDFNELKTKSYQEAIAPIIAIIDEIQLLPAFNNTNLENSLKNEIENNFITMLSLDQMTLGLKITKTIAGFAMQAILELILAHTFEEHIILVVDEVSVIENPILNRFLSEARKYNLSLILAGQYFEQISKELQSSIFTNVVNYFIFRVSKMDAITLENNMHMEVAVKNLRIIRVRLLSELNDRECIVRIGKNGRMLTAFKGRTIDFVSVPRKITSRSKKKTNIQSERKKKSFSIETKNSLKQIMKEQSASRKKINLGGSA